MSNKKNKHPLDSMDTKEKKRLLLIVSIALLILGIIVLIIDGCYDFVLTHKTITKRSFGIPISIVEIGFMVLIAGLDLDDDSENDLEINSDNNIENKDKKYKTPKINDYWFDESNNLYTNNTVYDCKKIKELCNINDTILFKYDNQDIVLYLSDNEEAYKLYKILKKRKKRLI